MRQYRERFAPELAQRLKAMQAAEDLLANRSSILFTELEKAVGAPMHRVVALRNAQEAATKALEQT